MKAMIIRKKPYTVMNLLKALALSVALTTFGHLPHAFAMDQEVQIQAQTDGISVNFYAQSTRELISISVRVVGPNNLVFEEKVEGDSLRWIPPDDLADGLYHWEAWIVTVDSNAPMREITPILKQRSVEHWFDTRYLQTHLSSGTFRVEHGLLENTPAPTREGSANSGISRVARAVMDIIMPSAMASGDFDNFVRIQNPSGSGVTDLRLQGNDQSFAWPNWWRVVNNGDANNRFEIREGQLTTRLAIAQGGHTGIGTESPLRRLHVVAPGSNNAALFIQNDDDSWRLGPGLPDGAFNLWGGDGVMRVRILQSAPGSSLVITSEGSGFGTSAPVAPIHIQRANNAARILVQDTGASDPSGGQTMFELINNGHPKFMLQDTSQANVRWEFRTAGTQGSNERFQINKLGSGVIEMLVAAGGNLTIAGTLSQGSSRAIKDQIVDLEPDSVLTRLDQLGLHEWSYKNDLGQRHIGPMAEDFHALFGLGGSDKHIAPGDLAGVALAAAKALQTEVTNKQSRIAELDAVALALQSENAELLDRLERLETLLFSGR